MNYPSYNLFAGAALTLLGTIQAATGQTTAFDTLEGLGKNRGRPAMKNVVGVTGTHGQDQPSQWLVLVRDEKVPGLMHEYAMKKARVVAERHFSQVPDQNLPMAPLPLNQLNIDSSRAFRIANQAATGGGIGFDAVNYLLRIHHTNPSPVWTLTLLDQQKKTVGIVFISASTGKLLSKTWYRPGTAEYTRVNSRSATEEIREIWDRSVDSVSRTINKIDKKLEEKLNRNKPTIEPANQAP